MKHYTEMSIDQQLEIAETILGMIVARVHRDETTDPTGFTITKSKLGEHAGKVIKDIKQGALQPTIFVGKF